MVNVASETPDPHLQSPQAWSQAVGDIALRIGQRVDLDEILHVTVQTLQALLTCDRTLIYQCFPDGSGQVIQAWFGDPQWEIVAPLLVSLGPTGYDSYFASLELELGQPFGYGAIADSHSADLTPGHRDVLDRLQVRAHLTVPLLEGEHLWGLLIAHHCQAAHPWQRLEIEGMQQLAVQVSLALSQASLVQQLRTAQAALAVQVHERNGAGDRSSSPAQDIPPPSPAATPAPLEPPPPHEPCSTSLFSTAPVGMFQTDAQGQYCYVNEGWEQITGISRKNALGNGWIAALPPEDRDRVLEAWHQAVAERRPFQWEYRCRSQTGKVIWVCGQAVATSAPPHQVAGYVGTIADITERKPIEAEHAQVNRMRLELGLQEQILDHVLAGYWDWNLVTDAKSFSPGFKTMLGYTDADSTDFPNGWYDLMEPEDIPRWQEHLLAHINSHGTQPFQVEVRYRHRNGSPVWALCVGQLIEWDAADNPQRIIGCHVNRSERQPASQELQATQEQLELVLAASSAGFWDWNLETDTIYFSPHWKAMLGYADHELDHRLEVWQALMVPADYAAMLQLIEDYHDGKQPQFPREQRFRHKNGSMVYALARAIPLSNDQGQVVRMVGSHLDITEAKRQELALKASEARYRKIIETTQEGVWIVSSEGKTTFVNQQMATMLGYEVDQMLGRSYLDFIHPQHQTAAQRRFQNRLKRGPGLQHPFCFQRQDGSELWVILSSTSVYQESSNDDQEAIGLMAQEAIGLMTDITPLVTAQKALRESEMQLSGILNSSLDGIMAFQAVRDHQNQIIDFEWTLSNPTACEIVQFTQEELIGERMLALLPGHREEGLFDLYVQVVESGEPARRQFHYAHDGLNRWIENIAVKLGDGFAVTFRDITEIKQAEQKFQRVNQQLERSVNDLKNRNAEMLMLSKISDFLQACRSISEACRVISTLVKPLFPDCSGNIYITNASRNHLELVTGWGDQTHSLTDFAPYECWGLRRGRVHFVERHVLELRCNHNRDMADEVETLCIPMIAQGETLGLFYLHAGAEGTLPLAQQQLGQTVAEQIGLAIANLHLRETLQHQSIRDELTGLFNRRYLEEFLQQEIARAQRNHYEIGVIMLDVDHFKRFNDTYGHEAGDLVLQSLSPVLRDHVRGSDIVCRYGGEELIVVLPESPLAETVARAERLRVAIAALQVVWRGQPLDKITASFGVAVFPQHGNHGMMLFQAADTALYQAKAAGRNQVVVAPVSEATPSAIATPQPTAVPADDSGL